MWNRNILLRKELVRIKRDFYKCSIPDIKYGQVKPAKKQNLSPKTIVIILISTSIDLIQSSITGDCKGLEESSLLILELVASNEGISPPRWDTTT